MRENYHKPKLQNFVNFVKPVKHVHMYPLSDDLITCLIVTCLNLIESTLGVKFMTWESMPLKLFKKKKK